MTASIDPTTTELVHVDPGTLIIGVNVRADTRPDAKDFARSIKERGVLEPITAYRDDDGDLIAIRGQRRTLIATKVGTPTGLVPVHVVQKPDDADRTVDQLTENLHRAAMRDSEVVAGIEQLSLAGVSAAQIAKRTALKRETVKAALIVAANEVSRERVTRNELSLNEAAIYAEFEHDEEATAELERARQWHRSLEHTAQRLRDEAAERALVQAEVERLRAEGLPVLDPAEAREYPIYRFGLDRLVNADGETVPEQDWPQVPGAVVVVLDEWIEPERAESEATDEGAEPDHGGDEEVEPVLNFVPVWITTDPETAGLHHPFMGSVNRTDSSGDTEPTEAQREAQREQRRLVIANNKAWRSAETVRREWLASFITRKTPPKGAEDLIAEAILTGNHAIVKAMEGGHLVLLSLLGIDVAPGAYSARGHIETVLAKQRTTKAVTMLTLGAIVAAWEASTSTHTWRDPSSWDTRIMSALVAWGYEPSEVERLLLGEQDEEAQSDPGDESDRPEVTSDGAAEPEMQTASADRESA